MSNSTVYDTLEYDGYYLQDKLLDGVIILVDIILTADNNLVVSDNIRFKDNNAFTQKINISSYYESIKNNIEHSLIHLRKLAKEHKITIVKLLEDISNDFRDEDNISISPVQCILEV